MRCPCVTRSPQCAYRDTGVALRQVVALSHVTMHICDLRFGKKSSEETMTWLFASPSRGWGQGSRKGHVRREVNANREAATGGPAFLAQGSAVAFDRSPLAVSLAGLALCSCSLSCQACWRWGEGASGAHRGSCSVPHHGRPTG